MNKMNTHTTASHHIIGFPVNILVDEENLDARDVSGISKALSGYLHRFGKAAPAGSIQVSEPKQGIGDIQTVRFSSASGTLDIDFYTTDDAAARILMTVQNQGPEIFPRCVIDTMVVMSVPKKFPSDMVDVLCALGFIARSDKDRYRIVFADDNAAPANLDFRAMWGDANVSVDVLQSNVISGKTPLFWD